MRKFLIKLAIIISPILIGAPILQPSIDNALKKTNCSPNYKEWNDIFESKINADIIIQGSSRACFHISPKNIDSTLNINSYNLGIDGYQFQMQFYRFLIYLKYNKKPKYIIQTTDYITLTKPSDLFNYEQFIPYVNNKLIRKAVIEYDGLDYRDFFIPLYKYIHNQYLFTCAIKSLRGDTFPSNGKYKGFRVQSINWDTSYLSFKNAHPNGYIEKIDTMTLRLFDSFVMFCLKNEIKLIFINSPAYFESKRLLRNSKTIDSIYLSYSHKYNIPYLDYSNDSICSDTINFYNSQHLNALGVFKFNNKLSSDLKKIIK